MGWLKGIEITACDSLDSGVFFGFHPFAQCGAHIPFSVLLKCHFVFLLPSQIPKGFISIRMKIVHRQNDKMLILAIVIIVQ